MFAAPTIHDMKTVRLRAGGYYRRVLRVREGMVGVVPTVSVMVLSPHSDLPHWVQVVGPNVTADVIEYFFPQI